MKRRKKLIEQIVQVIIERNWGSCSESCFKILYGLPSKLQIELSCFMIQRYLCVFETRYPGTKWPSEILGDVEKWVEKLDRTIPEELEGIGPPDGSFVYSLEALMLAYYYREKPSIHTSSCVCAINAAIGARSENVWVTDDPEGFEMWKNSEIPPARTKFENVAAIAVEAREWTEVIEWLKRKKVWTYPDEVDTRKMQQAIDYWIEGEMSLIVPETRELLEKNQKSSGVSVQDIL